MQTIPPADLDRRPAWGCDAAALREGRRVKAAGRLIRGPWPPPAPRVEGQPFEALPRERQAATLVYALYDLRRYRSDLSAGGGRAPAPLAPEGPSAWVSSGEGGADGRVLAFQEFAQGDGALGAARQRGHQPLGQLAPGLRVLLEVRRQVLVGEEFEDRSHARVGWCSAAPEGAQGRGPLPVRAGLEGSRGGLGGGLRGQLGGLDGRRHREGRRGQQGTGCQR